jgi:hypothetical protein
MMTLTMPLAMILTRTMESTSRFHSYSAVIGIRPRNFPDKSLSTFKSPPNENVSCPVASNCGLRPRLVRKLAISTLPPVDDVISTRAGKSMRTYRPGSPWMTADPATAYPPSATKPPPILLAPSAATLIWPLPAPVCAARLKVRPLMISTCKVFSDAAASPDLGAHKRHSSARTDAAKQLAEAVKIAKRIRRFAAMISILHQSW